MRMIPPGVGRVIRRALLVTAFLFAGSLAGAEVQLLSVARATDAVRGDSLRASISANGRFVAFESSAGLTDDDTDAHPDIYVADRETRTLHRLPDLLSDEVKEGPAISASGRWVAYHAFPAPLERTTNPRLADVFVYDTVTRRTFRMTPDISRSSITIESLFPRLSANGKIVLFSSNGHFTEHDIRRQRGVYVFNRDRGAFTLVSTSSGGVAADRPSGDSVMSADGRVIAFRSSATNLRPGVAAHNWRYHLYIKDLATGALASVDTREAGFPVDTHVVGQFAMDGAGGVILLEARRINVESSVDAIRTRDIYLYDVRQGRMRQLSVGEYAGRVRDPALSADGRFAAFAVRPKGGRGGGLFVIDLEKGVSRYALRGAAAVPSLSHDGRLIAFQSSQSTLAAASGAGVLNVYVVSNPFFVSDSADVKGDETASSDEEQGEGHAQE